MRESAAAVMEEPAKTYSMTGGPKGLPLLGMLAAVARDPIGTLAESALKYGDIIPFKIAGMDAIQLNHPDLVKYVLMENHRNYYKSDVYIRFESVLGQGLLTSNGDKWKRDRQKIQPMFKREQVEGYYFDIFNEVAEKYKCRWLALTANGKAEINITHEMASITIEVILKTIFGKANLTDETIASLHHSYSVFIEYLKHLRLFPKVDLEQWLHTPRYRRFKKELQHVEKILKDLTEQYRRGVLTDKYNMLALLIEAQKQDPEHFSELDIRDHTVSMVFAGFESTSILMQWMWYVLDTRPDIIRKLQDDITGCAPCTMTNDSMGLTHDAISRMDYLDAFFMETMRLYPPFWVTSRKPVEADSYGGYKVKPGTFIIIPQIVMHRHPRYWEDPNAFMPERFMGGKADKMDPGLYFPFSQGPRKCSGYKFVETEAKIVFSKLLPHFRVRSLNSLGNGFDPGISLKIKRPLMVEISRL